MNTKTKTITFRNFKSNAELDRYVEDIREKNRHSEPTDKAFALFDAKIKEVEKKCRERTFGSAYYFFLHSFGDVVEQLDGLTNSEKEGIKVAIFSASGPFPSAYKFTPYCSRVVVQFKRGKWHVLSVERWACPKKWKFQILELSDVAKEKVMNMFTNF